MLVYERTVFWSTHVKTNQRSTLFQWDFLTYKVKICKTPWPKSLLQSAQQYYRNSLALPSTSSIYQKNISLMSYYLRANTRYCDYIDPNSNAIYGLTDVTPAAMILSNTAATLLMAKTAQKLPLKHALKRLKTAPQLLPKAYTYVYPYLWRIYPPTGDQLTTMT